MSYGTAASASTVANVTLIGQGAPARVISPSAQNAAVDDFWREIGFNDASWTATTTGVGFDRDSSPNNALDSYIGTELTTAQMPSSTTRTSAYVRVPFTVTDKDQLTSLSLDLRYDDGFIAYLNGREIVRRFFQEDDARPQPQWDSRERQPSRFRGDRAGHVRSHAVPGLARKRQQRAGVSRREQHVAKHRFPDRSDSARAGDRHDDGLHAGPHTRRQQRLGHVGIRRRYEVFRRSRVL